MQLRKDQEEDVNIGPLLKCEEDGMERPIGWKYYKSRRLSRRYELNFQ